MEEKGERKGEKDDKVENIRKKFRTHLDQLLSQGEKNEN